jgi:putative transcriptional regulator
MLSSLQKKMTDVILCKRSVAIMCFADSIIKLRSELRISQKELSHELNVSCATVNRWENGRTVPNKMTMFVIRQFCRERNIGFDYDEGVSL